ncbi:MAG: hypothetical protein ABI690_07975 [Chloroflexota bacterium]
MTDDTDIWELRHGETLIGTLTVTDEDVTWFSATFEPTPEFAAYRPIFNEGSKIRTADNADAWAAWHEKVRGLGLRLVRLHNQTVTSDFILYIDGREADFRPRFDSVKPTTSS